MGIMEVVADVSLYVLIIIGCIFVVVALYRRTNTKVMINNHFGLVKIDQISLALSLVTFTYDELATATAKFSHMNLLSEGGGVGRVYKGVLPNGDTVAVKQSKPGSQGELEFRAEVEVINRIHHRHIVSLIGYCISDIRNMLVYQFVPNGTLQFHLHGKIY